MSRLYSYNREEPREMHQLSFPDGSTRTGDDYTQKELKAANVTGPYDIPEYDANHQRLVWDSSNLEYLIVDYPDEFYINRVREYRNFELSKTDRFMLIDLIDNMTQETIDSVKLYRQWLRELPEKMENKEINIPKNYEEFVNLFSVKRDFFFKSLVHPETGTPLISFN